MDAELKSGGLRVTIFSDSAIYYLSSESNVIEIPTTTTLVMLKSTLDKLSKFDPGDKNYLFNCPIRWAAM